MDAPRAGRAVTASNRGQRGGAPSPSRRISFGVRFGGSLPASYFERFQIPTGFGRNVGAMIEGTQPTGAREFVVIGAHVDGLGHSPTWALDRDAGFVMRPCADDNASGTAAAARRSAQRDLPGCGFCSAVSCRDQ